MQCYEIKAVPSQPRPRPRRPGSNQDPPSQDCRFLNPGTCHRLDRRTASHGANNARMLAAHHAIRRAQLPPPVSQAAQDGLGDLQGERSPPAGGEWVVQSCGLRHTAAGGAAASTAPAPPNNRPEVHLNACLPARPLCAGAASAGRAEALPGRRSSGGGAGWRAHAGAGATGAAVSTGWDDFARTSEECRGAAALCAARRQQGYQEGADWAGGDQRDPEDPRQQVPGQGARAQPVLALLVQPSVQLWCLNCGMGWGWGLLAVRGELVHAWRSGGAGACWWLGRGDRPGGPPCPLLRCAECELSLMPWHRYSVHAPTQHPVCVRCRPSAVHPALSALAYSCLPVAVVCMHAPAQVSSAVHAAASTLDRDGSIVAALAPEKKAEGLEAIAKLKQVPAAWRLLSTCGDGSSCLWQSGGGAGRQAGGHRCWQWKLACPLPCKPGGGRLSLPPWTQLQ